MPAKVRGISTARSAGPLGQFYKALVKSGAQRCIILVDGKWDIGCGDYVSKAHKCSGVPAVSQMWDWDRAAQNLAPADPVNREWVELEAEAVNTQPSEVA